MTGVHVRSTRSGPFAPAQALFTLALFALALAPLHGCATFSPADPDRPTSPAIERLPESAWPLRRADRLHEALASTPAEIFRLETDGTKPPDQIAPDLLRQTQVPEARITLNQAYGVGLIRRIEAGPTSSSDWLRSTRFISFPDNPDLPRDDRIERFDRWLRASSARQPGADGSGVRATDPALRKLLWEGVRLSLTEPSSPPRGLIIHMAGLGSSEWEQPLLDELTERGWAILRVATPRVWWFSADPIRIASGTDIDPVARRLAGVLDDLVAEPAYAAEAALEYLAQTRPDLAQRPLVMLGCSAGALAAPAVVARIPDKFSAIVLIGGGANLLKISQTSDLTDGGIRLEFTGTTPRATLRKRLFDRYLEFSRLDPYHTVRAMIGTPVLLVRAELDSTVPAESGTLLNQRLAHPDQLTYTGGHRLLFWSLGRQSHRIADWIDNALQNKQPTALNERSAAKGERSN